MREQDRGLDPNVGGGGSNIYGAEASNAYARLQTTSRLADLAFQACRPWDNKAPVFISGIPSHVEVMPCNK